MYTYSTTMLKLIVIHIQYQTMNPTRDGKKNPLERYSVGLRSDGAGLPRLKWGVERGKPIRIP